MRLGVGFAPRHCEEIGGEEHEPFIRPLVLEHPQAFFSIMKSFRIAALLKAELSELQIAPRRE